MAEVDDLIEEYQTLEKERQPFEEVWEEIRANVVPNRSGFENDDPRQGERRGQDVIFDGTPASALNMYASGSMGYLLSSSFNWFSLRVPDEQLMDVREVRMWLSKVDAVLYSMISRSNFYREMFSFFYDAGSIGTATVYRYWDATTGREYFSVRHPREIYVAENEHGEVDTCFRHTMMTNKQIVEQFGAKDSVNPRVEEDYHRPNGKYNKVHVLHVVKPNPDWDPTKQDTKSLKYKSWYIDKDNTHLMRESGNRVMPYNVWRVQKQSDERYGRGPGWNALADIKMLYAIAKSDMTAAQLLVNPPLDIPEERMDSYRFVPGGRNPYEEAGRKVEIPDMRLQIGAGLELQRQKIEIIKRHYLTDFFQMFAQAEKEMTATEVRQRREEKAVLLGPHITGLNHDVLDGAIDGLFNDAVQEGLIPPAPQILMESMQGRRLEVDYMGPLAQAQRNFFKGEPYRQAMQAWGGLAEVLLAGGRPPEFLDNYNWDYVSREMSKAGGLPEEAMLEEKVVAKMREARAKKQAEAEQLAKLEQLGKAAPGLNQPVQKGSMMDEAAKQTVPA